MARRAWPSLLLAAAALLSLSWSVLILASGGFTWTIGGLHLSSHDPVRPLAAGVAAALVLWYVAPEMIAHAIDAVEHAIARRAVVLACAAAAATTIAGVQWGTYAAGGA